MSRPVWTPAYLGLGSNLGNRVAHVCAAIDELNRTADVRVYRSSHLVCSSPLDGTDQPDYVNAVAALMTRLSAHQLLRICQEIEDRHGRERPQQRWGPRTLDVDILVFGAQVVDDSELCIPHPQMARRAFVLGPLCEVAGALDVPGLGRVTSLAAGCDLGTLWPVEEVTPRSFRDA